MMRHLLILLPILAIGTGCSGLESPREPDDRAAKAEAIATADALGITVDTEQMADFSCHQMGDTIMGDCSADDIARLTEEILAEREAEAVEATDSAEDRIEARRENRAEERSGDTGGLDPDLVAELEAEGIAVDLGAMTELPCHAMFDIIMGDCSEADVRQVAEELRTQREAGGTVRGAADTAPGFVPGDGEGGSRPEPRGPTITMDLEDGDRIGLDARPILWTVEGIEHRGYGYNGMVPGPLIRVAQNDRIFVDFENRIDMPTTIHWHGLRHDNEDDGVPGVTQPAILPGGAYEYELRFPDPGVYWYHPHVREDIQQDAGLYGVIIVEPEAPNYYLPADREEVLILDDLLVENGQNVPYGRDHANFAIMGRYGNQMLVNGRTDYRLAAEEGEVVRFHLANVANVRPFRLSFDGAPMRLVASDLSKYEFEHRVDSVLITPAERYTVDVYFDEARDYRILNETPEREYLLGRVEVTPARLSHDASAEAFANLRLNGEVVSDIEQFREHFQRDPDYELVLSVEIPDLVSSSDLEEAAHSEADDDHEDEAADHGDGEGHGDLEWEDDMLEANRLALGGKDVRWILRDRETGAENHQIGFVHQVGDIVKIRLFNDPDSDHPMQHPIHFHGQRLVVIAQDGQPVRNRVWKDTVLVPIGSTVDMLMEVTNPGTWMVHCHIAEHLETGMMYQFTVVD